MYRLKPTVVVALLLSLVACGEPLTKQQVTEQFSGNTVSKLSSLRAYKHMGSNDPSLGTRHIYHAIDGRAYYTKNTSKGWRRTDSGRWWTNENEICYSMQATLAEDHNGKQCSSAQVEVAFSSFEQGDTKNLAPVPRRATRTAPTRNTRNPNCVIGTEPGCSYSWLPGAAAVLGGGIAVLGAACSRIDCSAPPLSSSSAETTVNQSVTGSVSSGASTTSASRGVLRIEKWGKSPDGLAQQFKVSCHTRPSALYYYQDGQWHSGILGGIGKAGKTIEQLAADLCG